MGDKELSDIQYWEETLARRNRETLQQLLEVEDAVENHLETGALLIFKEVAGVLTDVERDINIYSLKMKATELKLQEGYAEKGIKAIKTREQLARDDLTISKVRMEEWKRYRDKLRNLKQFVEYYLEGDY